MILHPTVVQALKVLKQLSMNGFQGSWDNSVSIVMGYRLDGPGSIPSSARFFSIAQRPD
jgi:hypothetical protein